MEAEPILRVITGPHSGQIIGLSSDQLVIGRELSCDVVLEEPVLSRRHCEISRGNPDNGYRGGIRDLKSKNGTYLNGQRIDDAELQIGDVIRIGSTRIEYVVPHEDATEEDEQRGSEFYVRPTMGIDEDEDEKDPLVGKLVGPYKLLKKIGEGGMGSVYKSQDSRDPEAIPTALKLMNKALTLEEDQVARFRREFESGKELIHRNIVQTLDFGSWDETFYLVMEYVEGHELQDILDIRGRLSARGAIKVALQVALALEHAFKQKIIHRDIKPENILITPQGVVKLLDLGLAKKIKEETGGSSITKTGEGIGTLHYMAPEQTTDARGTDQRSDIYALGATLYHMIGGQPPFEAAGIWEFVELIQHGVPQPLGELVNDLPQVVWETVKVGLEKHPRDRYQTPRDFRKALEACLEKL